MKTIILDGHMIGARETGNETYIVQLSAALDKMGGYDYRLYTSHADALPPGIDAGGSLTVEPLPDLPSLIRIPFYYPRLARSTDASLLHMTYVAPPVSRCPVVLTVHDVSYRIFPEFFSPRVRFILGLLVGPSVRHAARVVTISECTRRDIVRFYRVPASRVLVTPLAAGPQFTPQPWEEVARVRKIFDIPKRYILAVGNVQPRKNLVRLVRAFGEIAYETPDLQLVIAGRSMWQGSEVRAEVDRLGLELRVRFIGYVANGDLPALYTGATIFCYPSLYEGFGLPPLEAMACGTPVVASNVASLPEVVGGAAIMFDPTSVDELGQALRALLDEETGAEYRGRGLARAAQFSWERTARLTRDVYDSVLEGQARGGQVQG